MTELGYALLIAAIIILTTERHSRIEFNRLVQEQLSAVDKTIAEGLARVFRSVDLMHFLDKLNRSPQAEIRLISRKIYSKYIDGLEAIEGGFQVDDLNWALESNETFYEILYKSTSFRKCEVRITHTGSIDTWLNEAKANLTLDRQQKCIEDNGVDIIRIFVGKNELSDKNNDVLKYIKVMESMEKHCIKCYYLADQNPIQILDMTWVPKLSLLSVWTPGVGGGVGSIKVTSDSVAPYPDNLEAIRRSLLERATSYEQIKATSARA